MPPQGQAMFAEPPLLNLPVRRHPGCYGLRTQTHGPAQRMLRSSTTLTTLPVHGTSASYLNTYKYGTNRWNPPSLYETVTTRNDCLLPHISPEEPWQYQVLAPGYYAPEKPFNLVLQDQSLSQLHPNIRVHDLFDPGQQRTPTPVPIPTPRSPQPDNGSSATLSMTPQIFKDDLPATPSTLRDLTTNGLSSRTLTKESLDSTAQPPGKSGEGMLKEEWSGATKEPECP